MIRLKLWVGALVSGLAAVVTAFFLGRRGGKRSIRSQQAKITLEKVEAGNEAVRQMSDTNRAAWLERLRNP